MREAIARCFREGGPRFLSAVLGTGSPIPPLWFPVISSQPQPTLMRKKTMKVCDAYHMIEITHLLNRLNVVTLTQRARKEMPWMEMFTPATTPPH